MSDAADSNIIYTALPITLEMFARAQEGDLPLDDTLSHELLALPHRSFAALRVMEECVLSIVGSGVYHSRHAVLRVVR